MDVKIDEQVFSKHWFHGVNEEEKTWLNRQHGKVSLMTVIKEREFQ